MQFSLAGKGTVSECREKLNATLATLGAPITPDQFVIRAACAYVVETLIDAPHEQWQRDLRDHADDKARGRTGAAPVEPACAFSISIDITTS